MAYLYLAIAIVAEVIATSALKASREFSQRDRRAGIRYCLLFYDPDLAQHPARPAYYL